MLFLTIIKNLVLTLTLEREAKKGPTYKTADTNGTTDAINFSINSGLIIAY